MAPVDAIRKHLSVWSLYWIFGIFMVLLFGAALWSLGTAYEALSTLGAIEGGTAVKSPSLAKPSLNTVEARAQSIILPYATIPELGITMYLPAEYKHIRGIGYHESSHTRAFSLTPVGTVILNDNAWDVDVSLDSAAPLPAYYIMETRGEYATATTVADIAMDPGTPVLAPISGTIIKVESKVIYDEYQDAQIEMIPDGHPDVRVAFLHVDQIRIKPGDKVVQGKTALGIPKDWRGSIDAELDDYVKPAMPHVHIQVNTPEPGQ